MDIARHKQETNQRISRRRFLKLLSLGSAIFGVSAVGGTGIAEFLRNQQQKRTLTGFAGFDGGQCLIQEGFEDDGWQEYITKEVAGLQNVAVTDTEAHSGNSSLRVRYEKGTHFGVHWEYHPVEHGTLSKPTRELYSSYWIKFPEGFQFSSDAWGGGHFIGHEHNPGGAETGDASHRSGKPDWATGLEPHRPGGDTTPSNILMENFMIDYGMSGSWGHPTAENTYNTHISVGDWHHIEHYSKLNTMSGGTPNSDGVYRWWVDGELVGEITNRRITTEPEKGTWFMFLCYWGGTWEVPVTQDIYIDDLTVAVPR